MITMRNHNDHDPPPGSDRQWWLTEGPESCFVCEARVHPEMLAYCVACDRGMCSICLYDSAKDGQALCAECSAELREPD